MKRLITKTTCFLLGLTIAISSCEKDKGPHGGRPANGGNSGGQPGSTAKYVQVSLNNYLPAAKVDSAIVIWEAHGVTQTVKMTLANNQYRVPLSSLNNNGNGVLTIQIFSQLKEDGKPLQWEHRIAYLMDRTKDVSVAAPADFNDPSWHPRAVFQYDNSMGSRFSALVALRPEDSYFELKGVEPVYAKRIEIVRSFHQKETGTVAFSRGWVGSYTNLDNKGNLVDRLHFSNLREQIIDKDWNQYRIRASFHLNSNPAMTYQFTLVQDKP